MLKDSLATAGITQMISHKVHAIKIVNKPWPCKNRRIRLHMVPAAHRQNTTCPLINCQLLVGGAPQQSTHCCTHPSGPYTILANGFSPLEAASDLSFSYNLLPWTLLNQPPEL